jgi:hypothetical protein
VQQLGEITEVAEARVDVVEVRHVVPVVEVRRRVDRVEPQAGDAQPGQVVQPPDQSLDVTDAVAVPVGEGVDVGTVNDGFLVPPVAHGTSTCPRLPPGKHPKPSG